MRGMSTVGNEQPKIVGVEVSSTRTDSGASTSASAP